MNYEFHPGAEAEFLESVGFYESRVQGLGNAFIDEFQVAIDLVCESPKQWQIEREPAAGAEDVEIVDYHQEVTYA